MTETASAPERAVRADASGVVHTPAGAAARIVSLVPSITELLFDLGLGDQIVGRTAFCVHPVPQVKAVRSVGGTKALNWDKLKAARPTHVIVNIDETPKELADALGAAGYTVVVTHPVEVTDNIALFRLMGALFGRAAEAEALVDAFNGALAAVSDAARAWPSRSVLYLIWREPWMTISRDTYIARMLALVNWLSVPATTGVRYPVIDLDEALLAAADLVLFSSEPFPFGDRHLAAFGEAFPRHAAKARLIDAEMVSWYGSRVLKGLPYLAAFATPTALAAGTDR
ncbi:putative periplasmic metal binding protein [uncultured Defluviicoccus sp.]|uniref:Putative periplasmic metal binding protein n=1 Tax=metagenome TaxID=256318 RepID=A0A380T9V4_9ZZZZ|nr:putative periplasmic metal binding protein [uncultured Defluviicoccus sp.]